MCVYACMYVYMHVTGRNTYVDQAAASPRKVGGGVSSARATNSVE